MLFAPLRDALASKELETLLGRLLPPVANDEQPISTRFEAMRGQLSNPRQVVPMFGLQGSGKSTFLNALTLGHPVLPIDADETTCVPVEIGFGAPGATVHFLDGRSQAIQPDADGLRPFVHQADNPGNRLEVDRILVTCEDPLLSNGLVLVDLPGTGSLTPANVARTRAYLTEAAGVMFMLRTNPPLTQSEALGVAVAWSTHPAAYFVQNRWNDETKEEVTQAHAHILEHLQRTAQKYNIPAAPPEVHLVNAYQAYAGKLAGDVEKVRASGLEPVRQALAQTSANWPEWIGSVVRSVLQVILREAFRRQVCRREELEQAKAAIENDIKAANIDFGKYHADLTQRCRDAEDEVRDFNDAQAKALDEWETRAGQILRNNMRTKLRAGIVDGHRLQEALKAEQATALDELYGNFMDETLALNEKLKARFDTIQAWTSKRPDSLKGVDLAERKKWEHWLEPSASSLGNLAGLAAGASSMGAAAGASAAAKAGALLGTTLAPGVGTAIGFVGGLIIGAVAGWLLKKGAKVVRENVTKARAQEAEPVVFDAIDSFTRETRALLRKDLRDLRTAIVEGLDAWTAAQKTRFEQDRDQKIAIANMSGADKEALRAQVAKDLAMLDGWLQRLEDSV